MAKSQRFLNVDFKPNLRTVEQDFLRVAEGLKDKRSVMLAAEVIARRDIDDMFDGEQDAYGNDWQEWKQTPPPSKKNMSYARRAKKYPNIGILQRTGELRRQAIKSTQFTITGNTLTYGGDLPTWAGVHLHGGKKVYADGYRIPKRSFLPFSPQGVRAVRNVFDAWATDRVIIIERVSSRGRAYLQVQSRAAKGRFGSGL